MPTLRDVLNLMADLAAASGQEFSADFADELERQLQRRFPAEKIYVPAPNSRKDPARGEEIRKAAQKLPTATVVQRFGVSRQLVAYHTKKGKNRDG